MNNPIGIVHFRFLTPLSKVSVLWQIWQYSQSDTHWNDTSAGPEINLLISKILKPMGVGEKPDNDGTYKSFSVPTIERD